MFPSAIMRPETDYPTIRFSGGENIAIPATKKQTMTQLQDYEIKVLNLNLPKMKIKKLMQIFPLKKNEGGFFSLAVPSVTS